MMGSIIITNQNGESITLGNQAPYFLETIDGVGAMKGPPIINIVNKGDVQTPVRIEFKGPATNPKISNRTTGEYIQVRRELAYGDVLIITTDFGAKRVEINGQNVFNWIDLDSSFWQLQPGDNIIEYTSDVPVEPAAVLISYRNRYVGV
jgi:phage-related protein